MEVTIVVATFGDPHWKAKALEQAIPSASAQPHSDVLAIHADSLAVARNIGAARAQTEWLCYLDADDELAVGYIDAMLATGGDLRAPELHLIHADGVVDVPDLAGRDIAVTNPCCIGTLVRRQMMLDVGGFWGERAWEDWSLFRRCWLAGATITHVADAVYRSFVDPAGRNSTVAEPRLLHRQIVRSHQRWLAERTAA